MSKISKMLTEIAGDPHYCNNTCTNVGHVTKETNRTSTEHFALLLKSECKKHGKEVVDHPQHYNHGKYECIDVIDDLKLNFNLGSALKYIWRCGLKDDEVTELEKAVWYLHREIENRKRK